jgi:hypothetical protein
MALFQVARAFSSGDTNMTLRNQRKTEAKRTFPDEPTLDCDDSIGIRREPWNVL